MSRAGVFFFCIVLLLCTVLFFRVAAAQALCDGATPPLLVQDVMLGTAISADYFDGKVHGTPRDRYLAEIERNFRIVTLENSGKMWNFRPSRDGFSWSNIDAIVDWAGAHNISLKFHALLYDVETMRPQWYQALSQEERYRALEDHVRTIVRRYVGRFQQWEVVNEPLTTSEVDYFGTGRPRIQVIADAFRWAREEDPRAILVLNDQVPIEDKTKSERLISFVNVLRAQNAPIQAVGLQSHFYSGMVPAKNDLVAFLRHISCTTHLPVNVTEFDVQPNGKKDWPAEQAVMYRRAFDAFLTSGVVNTIIMWGFYDGAHWKPGAGLFDDAFAAKPAYFALADLLHQWRNSPTQ